MRKLAVDNHHRWLLETEFWSEKFNTAASHVTDVETLHDHYFFFARIIFYST